MASAFICQCVLQDWFPGGGFVDDNDFSDDEDGRVLKAHGFQAYSSDLRQQPRGQPVREGEMWYLPMEQNPKKVKVRLYCNAITFEPIDEPQLLETVALVPFSLVRNCRFSNGMAQPGNEHSLDNFKIFKISFFSHGITYYFGCHFDKDSEQIAERERTTWVLDISHAIRLVTSSLYPSDHKISTRPLLGVPTTLHRLMAGYLLHDDGPGQISCVYAELHSHMSGSVRMYFLKNYTTYFYEDETCRTFIWSMIITVNTPCTEKVGINCSCFVMEGQTFTCRSLQERKFWLRAISNVKVKLQNHAPDPSMEELNSYRISIRDHLSTTAKDPSSTSEQVFNCGPLLGSITESMPQTPMPGTREYMGKVNVSPVPILSTDTSYFPTSPI